MTSVAEIIHFHRVCLYRSHSTQRRQHYTYSASVAGHRITSGDKFPCDEGSSERDYGLECCTYDGTLCIQFQQHAEQSFVGY